MTRANQKERTRTAIVEATRMLLRSGEPVTMPAVARAALVSEATAYRYFAGLPVLLQEAEESFWPAPAEALRPAAGRPPVERVALAAELLLRGALANQGVVRAMIASTIQRADTATARPARRFGLIDEALAPLEREVGAEALAQLKRDLAVVISAEALFTLTDLCHLEPEAAVASVIETARTLTSAAAGTVVA